MTQTERIVNTLKSNGFSEVDCRSGKYRQFRIPGLNLSFFVGKRGALRYGRIATKSKAINKEWFFRNFDKETK